MSSDQTRRLDRHALAADYATSAYRADLASRAQPLGEHDSEWLAVASLLEQAARLPESAALPLLHLAERLAADVVHPKALEDLVSREWNTDVHPADAIVAIAEQAYDCNACRFAAHILDALLAANHSLSALHRGRILARRARVAFKVGDLDGAADRYGQIMRLGRATDTPELVARVWVGRAAIAQFHGNYPEVWRCARSAARIADQHGFHPISHNAHNWLMIAASVGGRLEECLAHGWLAYQAAAGNPLHKAEVLVNLSQALLESGRPRPARAGFAAILADKHVPVEALVPALGGLALASAMLGDDPSVEWASRELERLDRAGARRYNIASALLECAMAFATIGREASATRHAAAALRLARMHGFHEVAFKAESLDVHSRTPVGRRPVRLSARSAAVARDVERLQPDELPKHVALAVTDG